MPAITRSAQVGNNPINFVDPLGLSKVGSGSGGAQSSSTNPSVTFSGKFGLGLVGGVDLVVESTPNGFSVNTTQSSVLVGFGAALSAKGRADLAGVGINPFPALIDLGDASAGNVTFGTEVSAVLGLGLEATTAIGSEGGNFRVTPVAGAGVEAVAPAVRVNFGSIGRVIEAQQRFRQQSLDACGSSALCRAAVLGGLP